MNNQYVFLDNRAVIGVRGTDNRTFLQGLISQDIGRVGPECAAYGAFLTPQGKYLHDFCIAERQDTILLDCEAARADDLVSRMSRYKLRADVSLGVEFDLAVAAVFGGDIPDGLDSRPGSAMAFGSGLLYLDPRHTGLGCRAILARTKAGQQFSDAGFMAGSLEDYEALRVSLTIPDGSRDLEIEKTVLLEANFDTLNGIDWNKGCYLGQELTARTRYRGLVKRRLITVSLDEPAPPTGTPIECDGKEVGVLRSIAGGHAIASLRTEVIEAPQAAALTSGGRTIRMQ